MDSVIEVIENTSAIDNTAGEEITSGIEKWAPWFAVLWLLYAMNSILAWYSFGVVFRVLAATGVVFATYQMEDRVVTRKRGWIVFMTFL